MHDVRVYQEKFFMLRTTEPKNNIKEIRGVSSKTFSLHIEECEASLIHENKLLCILSGDALKDEAFSQTSAQ